MKVKILRWVSLEGKPMPDQAPRAKPKGCRAVVVDRKGREYQVHVEDIPLLSRYTGQEFDWRRWPDREVLRKKLALYGPVVDERNCVVLYVGKRGLRGLPHHRDGTYRTFETCWGTATGKPGWVKRASLAQALTVVLERSRKYHFSISGRTLTVSLMFLVEKELHACFCLRDTSTCTIIESLWETAPEALALAADFIDDGHLSVLLDWLADRTDTGWPRHLDQLRGQHGSS